MHYFFNNCGLYSQALIIQTKYKVMMSKEGSAKIVNFKTPWAGVLVLGRSHTSHIVKMYYFFQYRMQWRMTQETEHTQDLHCQTTQLPKSK